MPLAPTLAARLEKLLDLFRGYRSCAIAFSGGVDSAVAAKAAHLALGDGAVAVTGASASLASGELEAAGELARLIGIRHEVLATDEFSNPAYVNNAPDRCYHCKTELYDQLRLVADRLQLSVLVNGANLDDQGDYRPGMTAAGERAVRSPLLECELNKDQVRELAAHWGLPVWDKPASPCLSSRIAYGEEVTPERVAMIDRAEQFLRQRGFRELRVRYHRGDLARLELPPEAIARICESPLREELAAFLKSLGFKYVSLDLEGLRTGSMNAVLPLASLKSLV